MTQSTGESIETIIEGGEPWTGPRLIDFSKTGQYHRRHLNARNKPADDLVETILSGPDGEPGCIVCEAVPVSPLHRAGAVMANVIAESDRTASEKRDAAEALLRHFHGVQHHDSVESPYHALSLDELLERLNSIALHDESAHPVPRGASARSHVEHQRGLRHHLKQHQTGHTTSTRGTDVCFDLPDRVSSLVSEAIYAAFGSRAVSRGGA